ncbi:YdcF family protein [Flavitalea flava]
MKIPLQFGKKASFVLRLLVVWFLIHILYMTIDGMRNSKGKADIAIVLGNRVDKDSSLSPVLQGRVDKALKLYREGRVREIFVSGGSGEYGVPEGTAMKRYLVSQKVPPEKIIVDNKGDNTYLTAVNFNALNEKHHYASAFVVSSFYHITRSKYIIRKLGYPTVYGESSDSFYWNDTYGILRDFVAFYKYVLFY